jgi:C-terminal processing protease CtpA/Prc
VCIYICLHADRYIQSYNIYICFYLFSLENTFEVKLFKNSSGLGFSFSREDNLIPEQMNTCIVRVKKLFPGQPAAESGKIEVGDVILKVNGASLKGLSQQVSLACAG